MYRIETLMKAKKRLNFKYRIARFVSAFSLFFRKKGKIKFSNGGSLFKKCNFISKGKNNNICCKEGNTFKNCKFYISGSNNRIIVGAKNHFNSVQFFIEDSNNIIVIGDNNIFSGKTQLASIEGTEIHIGNECLFSQEIYVVTGDSHSMLDMNGHRTNPSNSIYIGNHVWVGYGANICKGVIIGNDSVVAKLSLVNKTFNQNNILIGGVPARILKDKINWDNKRI